MKVLVTGAAGFIGSHLCESLLDRGYEVVGLDGFIESYARDVKERNLQGLIGRNGFEFVETDLRTADLDPLVERVDAVVHLAAMAGLSRSWTDFRLYQDCNILAVERLCATMVRTGVERFVHVSTSSVYGIDAVGDESVPLQPISPYGVTKLAAEQLIAAYGASFRLPWLVLRYFSIFGPRQRPDMGYHIMIEALLDGRPVTVFGDGRQSRSNTYVDDCVAGTIAALERGHEATTYNIGGGDEIDVLEVLATLGEALGTTPEIRFGPPRPGDQRRTRADFGRARRDFGFQPSVSVRDGLRRQAAWHLELRREAAAAPRSTTGE